MNPNQPTGSAIYNFLPGTIVSPGIGFMTLGSGSEGTFIVSHDLNTRIITKSYDDRQYTVEFDDSLVDLPSWKNIRYDGVKATGKRINKYSGPETIKGGVGFSQIVTQSNHSNLVLKNGPIFEVGFVSKNAVSRQTYAGDTTIGRNPVINNETTAIYISNTVIGGTEDNQFTTIKNHSYVGINKIVIVNLESDTVQVLDKNVEGFEQFHRFITNDLPTGGSFNLVSLDNSISTNLKQNYRVKMNKGWLLKSFDFNYAGEFSGSSIHEDFTLTANNSMYLYKGGTENKGVYFTGSLNIEQDGSFNSLYPSTPQGDNIRFRYATAEIFGGDSDGTGNLFEKEHWGPSFASSSIINNKFTSQFYSGSYGVVQDTPTGSFTTEIWRNSGLAKSSRFIGINCLNFLKQNNADTNLTQEEKTEIHVTFFEGTKDFSLGISGSESIYDERSIGTFEVNQNQQSLDIGDHCNDFLPQTHEITFKGPNDGRFIPQIDDFTDDIANSYLESTASSYTYNSSSPTFIGCTEEGDVPGTGTFERIQKGVNVDTITDAKIYVQGGALGPVGRIGALTSSHSDYGKSLSGSMTADNYYSGSFRYEVSFLDKDHTLIADIDKDAELFDGIGTKGLAIIPEFTHTHVKQNVEYYLKKAGLIENAPQTRTITKRIR